MANYKNNHYPRGLLQRQKWQPKAEAFKPTVSIERPISLAGAVEDADYWRTAHRALGKVRRKLPSSQRQKHHPVRPSELRLVQFQHNILADQAAEILGDQDRTKAMERLACLLQEVLFLCLKDVPIELPIKLGQLSLSESIRSRQRRQTTVPEIAAQPLGWKGYRAHYASTDMNSIALKQLATEGKQYRSAIRQIHPHFEPEDIVRDPSATLLTKDGKLPRWEFYEIRNGLTDESILPINCVIRDPVLCLRTGLRERDLTLLPVRDLGQLARHADNSYFEYYQPGLAA